MKQMIFAVMAAVVMVSTFSLLQSCSNTELENIENESNDLPYLSLESGVNFSKLSEKDFVIIGNAFERVQISREGLLYRIEQKSGKQVNISSEIFEFIKKSVSTTNVVFKEKTLRLSNTRFKVEGETPIEPTKTDCLAYAIGYSGAGTTYNEANDMIVEI